MSIYREKSFPPTYLYIKQHPITHKLYFGKTASKDPLKYSGSGKYWLNHLKKYGNRNIITLWSELFIDSKEMEEFAIEFSKKMNIVESSQWLNLRPENGLDGAPLGNALSETTKLKIKNGEFGGETPYVRESWT